MKLNYTSFLTASFLAIVGTNVNAEMLYDIYAGAVAGFGGMEMFQENHNRDWSAQSYGAIFGIDLPVVRFEAEYNYLDSERVDMQTLIGNAYVKIPGLMVINPYLGIGFGMMFNATTNYYSVELEPAIAYQGMLGTTLNIPALPVKIDIEGRILYMPEVYSKHDVEINAMQYDARVKLRYIF